MTEKEKRSLLDVSSQEKSHPEAKTSKQIFQMWNEECDHTTWLPVAVHEAEIQKLEGQIAEANKNYDYVWKEGRKLQEKIDSTNEILNKFPEKLISLYPTMRINCVPKYRRIIFFAQKKLDGLRVVLQHPDGCPVGQKPEAKKP